MDDLKKRTCKPCEGGVPPLGASAVQALLRQLASGWTLAEGGKEIRKEYVMKDFLSAVRFIQAIAEVAEREDHHPDLHLTGYRKLVVALSTHSIGGLSYNDFILAAKIDDLPKELKK